MDLVLDVTVTIAMNDYHDLSWALFLVLRVQ